MPTATTVGIGAYGLAARNAPPLCCPADCPAPTFRCWRTPIAPRRSQRPTEGKCGGAYLIGLAERHPFIVGVVGWLDLASPEMPERLDAAAKHRRLVGFREILQGEPEEKFLNPAFIRGLRLLGERDYAYDVLVHSGQFYAVGKLLHEAREDQRLVLDHLGKPNIRGLGLADWATRIRALSKDHPNLHCKLSGMVTEAAPGHTPEDLRPYMETVIEAFGTKRVMYGSDWPVSLLNASSYGAVFDTIADFVNRLGAEACSDILGGNAQRFYKLQNSKI